MSRVVITGLGAVSPCGNDVPSTWAAVSAGRSGIGQITRFDCTGWPVTIAGEVKDWDPSGIMTHRQARRADRFTQYAFVASAEALADAGFPDDADLGERAGVYIGSGIGGLGEIARGAVAMLDRGVKSLSPFLIPKSLTNLAGGMVSIRWGIRGPSLCITTACATGNHSIGEAWRAIRLGDADIILAGGTESAIEAIGIGGFAVMRALSRQNSIPERASRPFDLERDGFVMGEGAGILVLEALDHAVARGARIYAEVVGYGNTSDAHHVTAPAPGHAGAVRCMQMALRSAGLPPEAVHYINAHGTSTRANDSNETSAIRKVFGEHADALLVSSTKSMTGHLLGAAGGLEAVLTAKALQTGLVPPTSTLTTPDPTCDLDYVPRIARRADIQIALSNAFGFGGTNASLVFRRWPDTSSSA